MASPYYTNIKDRSYRASNAKQESMLFPIGKRKQLKIWGAGITRSHLERVNNLHLCINLLELMNELQMKMNQPHHLLPHTQPVTHSFITVSLLCTQFNRMCSNLSLCTLRPWNLISILKKSVPISSPGPGFQGACHRGTAWLQSAVNGLLVQPDGSEGWHCACTE